MQDTRLISRKGLITAQSGRSHSIMWRTTQWTGFMLYSITSAPEISNKNPVNAMATSKTSEKVLSIYCWAVACSSFVMGSETYIHRDFHPVHNHDRQLQFLKETKELSFRLFLNLLLLHRTRASSSTRPVEFCRCSVNRWIKFLVILIALLDAFLSKVAVIPRAQSLRSCTKIVNTSYKRFRQPFWRTLLRFVPVVIATTS